MSLTSKVPQQLAPTPIFQTATFTNDGNPFITPAAQLAISGDNLDRTIIDNGDGTFSGVSNVGIGVRAASTFTINSGGGTGLGSFLDPDDPANGAWVPNTCDTCTHDSTFVDVMTGPNGDAANPLPDGIDDDPRFDTTDLIDSSGNNIADNARALVRRRLLEVGPRIVNSSYTTYQVQAGVRGDLSDSWGYDAYIQVGNVTIADQQLGNVNRDRFNQALMLNVDPITGVPAGGLECADTGNNGSTIGCTPMNLFGLGNISEDAADFLKVAVASTADFDQNIYGLNFTGDLGGLELPGGQIGVALGFERIENDFAFRPSQDLAAGTIAGFNGAPPVSGSYSSNSYYAEAYLPILMGVPMFEQLDMELAFRSSDYSTSGNVEAYKISGSWAPIADFRIRGGYNRAVRAPGTFRTLLTS